MKAKNNNTYKIDIIPSECCDHAEEHIHVHTHEDKGTFLPAILSGIILISTLYLEHILKPNWFKSEIQIITYIIAYIPVGLPVIKEAWHHILKGDFFSEFFLMSLATLGAFAIGEYPEAIAVMLFYTIGEAFQGLAVKRAKSNIQNLIDQRPDQIQVLETTGVRNINAKEARIGQIVQLKPGEKVAVDGKLISEKAAFNTAALTGESKPDTKLRGEFIYAGMVNLNTVSQIEITEKYQDSKLSKILDMVQNATKHKAPTELFIRKFAKIYTPFVVLLALGICVIPYLYLETYIFSEWLYKALVFLVISCPCALVISIPLGYFGGIGAASKNGILIKGGHYLDTIADIENIVMDKTGTLTEGIFEVKDVKFNSTYPEFQVLSWINEIEKFSTHPVATAIHRFVKKPLNNFKITHIEEVAGMGLKGLIDGKEILVGNFRLLNKYNIPFNRIPDHIAETVVAVAYDEKYIGYITVADKIKPESAQTIERLHHLNIKTTLLSGDKKTIVEKVAKELHLSNYYGELLPEDKVDHLKQIRAKNGSVAFVGDGLNDAPVIAMSDVGIAMGALGSDATIETADIVIQDDNPLKIPLAVKIGKKTKAIVWQNIVLAFGVKAIVLFLGANGLATMWEAVFADVGVALLAILNAIRIQNFNWK